MANLRMEEITKRFPGTLAVNRVDLDCSAGSVLGLVGENGAGKSTLMNVLAGVHRPDDGTIYLDDTPQHFHSYSDARRAGIGVVYQNLSLLPDISVAENIMMGVWPRNRLGMINWKRVFERTGELLQTVGSQTHPRTLVRDLTMPERQLVEVAKVLNQDPNVVVFDEPTAPLSRQEVEYLFSVIKDLKQRGKSIIFISHRLEEVLDIADTITVLKDAEVVVTDTASAFDTDRLVRSMVGRDIVEMFPEKHQLEAATQRLDFSCTLERSGRRIAFSGNTGEILGFGGLQGQGQLDVLKALFGLGGCRDMQVSVDGKRVSIHHPQDAMRAGISLVPENRVQYGVFVGRTVRENLTVATLDRRARNTVIDRKAESEVIQEMIQRLSIRLASSEQTIQSLSGGNMQKVVVGRWLLFDPKIVIALEPTQGIDVGTKQQLYTLFRELADRGVLVIFYTSDMLELVGMCNRVLVMNHGMLTGEVQQDEISEENIMRAAVSNEDIIAKEPAG